MGDGLEKTKPTSAPKCNEGSGKVDIMHVPEDISKGKDSGKKAAYHALEEGKKPTTTTEDNGRAAEANAEGKGLETKTFSATTCEENLGKEGSMHALVDISGENNTEK
eukprot:516522-Ditylum_brightwellii.AAC.1